MLCFCFGLQAVPQEPAPSPVPKVTPESTSALRRWWEGLSRQRVIVQNDDHSVFIKEAGWSVPERVYQRTPDAEGRFQESYRENGHPRTEGQRPPACQR